MATLNTVARGASDSRIELVKDSGKNLKSVQLSGA